MLYFRAKSAGRKGLCGVETSISCEKSLRVFAIVSAFNCCCVDYEASAIDPLESWLADPSAPPTPASGPGLSGLAGLRGSTHSRCPIGQPGLRTAVYRPARPRAGPRTYRGMVVTERSVKPAVSQTGFRFGSHPTPISKTSGWILRETYSEEFPPGSNHQEFTNRTRPNGAAWGTWVLRSNRYPLTTMSHQAYSRECVMMTVSSAFVPLLTSPPQSAAVSRASLLNPVAVTTLSI